MVINNEGTFNSDVSLKMFYRAWLPEDGSKVKTAIGIVHGAGEHSGRYDNIGRYLAARDIAVYAYDLRGHGKSPGKRGHVNSFDDFLVDTNCFLNSIREQQPGKNVFLLGHSLGGLIAAVYAEKQKNLAGLILSSPLFKLKMPVPGWKAAIGRLLSYISPSLTMSSGLNPDDLCHVEGVCTNYRSDPLVHSRASVRFYTELLKAQSIVMKETGKLNLSLLLLYGTGDRIVDPDAQPVFFAKAGSMDKTIKAYDGWYHEIFNEKENETVFEDVEGWVGRRTGS
jgi:lysophospholipase